MRRISVVCALSVLGTCLLLGTGALAAGPPEKGKGNNTTLRVNLKGLEEAPVVISGASGVLELDINEAAGTIAYDLSYDDLEGTVTQSHIHIGQKNIVGGIAIWLCQTPGTAAPAAVAAITPVCPGPHSGTVSGTVTAANVIGPAGQAVPAGAFADVLTAIRAGKAYGNVHSTSAPGGEVRGQLH